MSKYSVVISIRNNCFSFVFTDAYFNAISTFEYNLHNDLCFERHVKYVRDNIEFHRAKQNIDMCTHSFVITNGEITEYHQRLLFAIDLGVGHTFINAEKVIVERLSCRLREDLPCLLLFLGEDKFLSSYVDRPLTYEEVKFSDFGNGYITSGESIKNIFSECSDVERFISTLVSFTDNISCVVPLRSVCIMASSQTYRDRFPMQLNRLSRNKNINFNIFDRQKQNSIIEEKLKSLCLQG